MKKRILSLIMVIVLAVSALGIIPASAATTYSVTVKSQEKYSMAYEVLTIINKERTSRGLSKLTMDKSLLDAAMLRAAELRLLFSHDRPDGSSCFTAFDWDYSAAENIAAGFTSAEAVCDGWMNSEGHRANILTSGFKSIGIGCAYIDGVYYWTQEFDAGTPVSVSQPANKTVTRSTTIDSSLKSEYIPSSTPVVTSSSSTPTTATIKWSKVSNANGYRVYKYDSTTKTYKSLATLSSSVTSYTDKTLAVGETGKYVVKAYRKNGSVTGWTAKSSAVSVKAAPQQVKLGGAASSKTAVRITWTKVECDGYRIYRLNPSTGTYVYVASASKNAVECRMTGLKSKTTYKYKVRAYSKNANGAYVFGPYSAVKTVSTK